MDDAKQRIDGTGDHIWLRYATQFTTNGRTRTVEMSIPVPLGASQQQREELLREAEAGMLQLSSHVEKIATQVMRGQGPSVSGTPLQGSGSANTSSSSSTRPASVSAPQTAEQPSQSPVRTRESQPELPPASQRNDAPLRQSVGASMPSSAGGDVPNNLSIPQFVKLVGETLGLDSKQAMNKLGVKSLSGINLRKAYEQLKQITPLENVHELEQPVPPARSVRENLVPASRPAANSAPVANQAQMNAARNPAIHQENPPRDVRNEPRTAIGFDEEEQEPDEEGALLHELDDVDELDFSQELTNQQRVRAREVMKELREFGGMTVASANRLLVLNNIISSQISEQQLLQLIQGVWNLNSSKKLKIEQAEKLISWAKEDDFVNEVEDVLKLLEEEG